MTDRPTFPRRRTGLAVLVAVIAAAAIVAYLLTRPPSRRVVDLPGSIAADCSRPVDVQLNAWLASVPDGSTARFAKGGCYRQADSLWLRDRHDVVVDGNGATFAFDMTSNLTQYYRSNWRVLRGAGVTLRNMTIRGACKPRQCGDGSPPPVKDGYGQHGVNLESTRRPTIDSVHVQDVLSDGIAAEGTLDPKCCWGGEPTSNMTIENSHIERVGRQGIGITDLRGGVIKGTRIENGPEVGIDVEVDVAGFVARDLRFVDNTFDKIHANVIANGGLGADPAVSNITIEGNTMVSRAGGCGGGIYLRAPGPNPKLYRSGFTIRNNRLKLIGPLLQAERIKNLVIEGNTVDYKEVGCGQKGAVELLDSHSVKLGANALGGYPRAVYRDPASTGISGG